MTGLHPRSYSEVEDAVADLMSDLERDLAALVAIPSVAAAGYPPEPVHAAHDLVVDMLRAAGAAEVDDLVIPGKIAPVVVATVPGPPDAPTVLLYSHYDVVPADDVDLWDSPPFEATVRDGAVYGRGTADSKANIVAILGALRVCGPVPPVTLRIVLEGQEEFGSPFDTYPLSSPDLFASDAMVIADVGNVRPGVPTLTVALRGSASVTVTARTLASDKHSGLVGSAAPDARLALIRALASLHDDAGNVAVDGLRRSGWDGIEYTDEEFRALAEVLDGVPLLGTGPISERIWSGPAITVTGFDAPSTAEAVNAVAASASATINLRIEPGQDSVAAQAALVHHLAAQRPFGVPLEVEPGEVADGFAVEAGGPGLAAATTALARAWGSPPGMMAGGGSIPLVVALDRAVPHAEKLLFGATDGFANIHGPNERVLLDEMRRSVIAKVVFLHEFARNHRGRA